MTESEAFAAGAIGEEAVVADAVEAIRQDVQQKAPQEFFEGQGHAPLLVLVC